MKVRVEKIATGNHPNEVVVSVDTTSGPERLVVHQRSIEGGGLDIGYPINKNNTDFLVELPRETISGSWRVWVPENVMID